MNPDKQSTDSLDGASSTSAQSVAYTSGTSTTPGSPVSLTAPATPAQQPPGRPHFKLPFGKLGYTLLSLLVAGGLIGIVLNLNKSNSSSATSQYNTVKQSLDAVADKNTSFGNSGVIVNGTLKANASLIIAPTSQPQAPSAGQLYFDQNSHLLNYYNGSAFVGLGLQNTGVQSIGGVSGQITLGGGLVFVGNQLTAVSIGITAVSSNSASLTVNTSGGTVALDFGAALPVGNGGTGAASLAANGVLVGNGASAISSVTAASAGLCLLSTAGAPVFGSCTGGGAVTSLNGLTGALNIANASGAGTTITINDASTAQKGIAQFNATNFTASAGTINTIQDIATTSSPTFATVNTNSLTPSSALTIGATGQSFTLQGNASSTITATGGGFTTTVGFTGVPVGAVTYQFDRTPTAGNYNVCTTAGNCVGVGGSVSGSGTFNRVTKFTATGTTVGDSSMVDDGTSVTFDSNVNVILQGATANISNPQGQSGAESFGLGATISGTGKTAVGHNASASGFGNSVAVGNGSSANSWGVAIGGFASTTSNDGVAVGENATAALQGVAIGSSATVTSGSIAIGYQATTVGLDTIALGAGAATTDWNQFVVGSNAHPVYNTYFGNGVSNATPSALTMHATGGSGANVAGANFNIASGAGTGSANGGNINLQVATPGIAGSNANVPATVFSISGNNGSALFQNATNSTTALNVQTAAGNNLLTADTSNGRVGVNLGGANTPALASGGLEVSGSLRISGTGVANVEDTYTTPNGSSLGARFSIVNNNPDNTFGQLIALGLKSTADTSNRAIAAFDARAAAHQPTIGVISPAESQIFGLSWDGSNTTAYLKSSSSNINLNANSTDSATFSDTAINLLQNTTIASSKTLTLSDGTYTQTYSGIADAATINATNTSGTQTNGLLINRNGVGGTTTNGLNITQTTGTLTNGLSFSGTIGTDINRSSGTLTVQGANGVQVKAGTSATGFQVQTAAGVTLLNVDTSANAISLLSGSTGETGAWATAANAVTAGRQFPGAVAYNGYMYVVGGADSTPTAQNTIYYAKINADGSPNTWTTAPGGQLPAGGRYEGTVIIANGYMYILGGIDSSSNTRNTVFYTRINNDGTLGTWASEATNLITTTRDGHSSAYLNGYVYVLSGEGSSAGPAQATTYYAKFNPDGSVGAWANAGVTGLSARRFHSTVAVNGYVYIIGGQDTTGTSTTTVQYAKQNADGTLGSWATTSALPTALDAQTSLVADGYVYTIGGRSSGTAQSAIYYAKINNDGTLGAWATSGKTLPAARFGHASIAVNGYLYAIAGNNAGTQTSVYYAPLGKLQVNGDLDLVGLQGVGLTDSGSQSQGSAGGQLTAGNTRIIGSLNVAGTAALNNGLNITGTTVVNGVALLQPTSSLVNGQIGFTETATFANATAAGTVRGFQQNLTVVNTTAGTSKGLELNLTDNSVALTQTNKGIEINLAGSNANQQQIGADLNISAGLGLRSIVTGAGTTATSCGGQNITVPAAGCFDATGANAVGVASRTSATGTTLGSASGYSGTAVFGYNNAAAPVAGRNAVGLEGVAAATGTNAFNAIGVYGEAGINTASAAGTTYGGYFTFGTSQTTNGAALYATNSTVAANILQLADNTTTVMTVADGGATTFNNQTNSSTAFQVQNASNVSIFSVDTTNGGAVNIAAVAVPTVDQVSITNAGQAVTTANVNGLHVNYVGGSAAVESAGLRVDFQPGGTSGGTWNGLRIVANATGAASGVAENGIKLEGPSSPGAGTEIAVNITTGWDIGMAISSGGIQMSGQTDPTAPTANGLSASQATGNVKMYAQSVDGRVFIRALGPNDGSYSLQPSLFEHQICFLSAGVSATNTQFGCTANNLNATAPTGGTVTEATGAYNNYLSNTANSNDTAASGIQSSAQTYFRGSVSNGDNGFFYMARLYFPDASYATNTRFFAGLADASFATATTGIFAADNPGDNRAGFSWSTVRGDTNFQFSTRDGNGGTENLANTSMAFTAQHVYDFYIYVPKQGSTMYWRIDDVTGQTSQTGSVSSHLPTASTGLRVGAGITNTATGTGHNIGYQHLYTESDR